jgi:hypothetical protein
MTMTSHFQVKSFVLGALFGGIAVVAVVWGWNDIHLHSNVVAAGSPSTQPAKIKWRYESFEYLPGSLEQQCNSLQDNGWEIVSVSKYALPNSTTTITLVVARHR